MSVKETRNASPVAARQTMRGTSNTTRKGKKTLGGMNCGTTNGTSMHSASGVITIKVGTSSLTRYLWKELTALGSSKNSILYGVPRKNGLVSKSKKSLTTIKQG